MPTLKAYECRLRGFDEPSIIYAATAGSARYSFLLRVRDPYPSATFADVRVRRSSGRDMAMPAMPEVNQALNDREREIVLHSFGGGSHVQPERWGYRNHYCVAPHDPVLNRLRDLGLFRGPCGVDKEGDTPGWVGAFWYLTDAGKELARALIAEREV